MLNRRRLHSEAALRQAERRQRADDAPRLALEIPRLESLRLEMIERREGTNIAEAHHIRRFVVDSAPALFLSPCGDPRCKEGGHDITSEVMSALRTGSTRFEGEDECRGSLGTGECTRVLHYTVVATYKNA